MPETYYTIPDAAHELEIEYQTLRKRIEKLEADGETIGVRTEHGKLHILLSADIKRLRKLAPVVGRPKKVRE